MKERTGAREGDTRAPFFLAPIGSKGLLHRLVRVPREGARGADSEIFVLSTSFKVLAIKVYDTSFINKTHVLFAAKLNNDKYEQNPKYICHIAEQN